MKNERAESRPFYGIYIVAACFVTLFFLWGMVLNTFPIFMKPITEDMNWSRGALSVAILMGSLGTMLFLPAAGKAVDRYGVKPVMLAGALFTASGLLLGGLVSTLWHIYVAFFLVGSGIACGTLIPCSLVISNWFLTRRGTAMGIAFVGMASGGMVMAPIANWIIIHYGWRTAFVVAGLEIIFIVLPTIFFIIHSHPSDKGLKPYGTLESETETESGVWGPSLAESLKLPVFWEIAGIFLILGTVTAGINYHGVAYLNDVGYLQTKAAYTWSVAMGLMVAGQLFAGPAADRWGARNTMTAACVLFSASIIALVIGKPYSTAIAFAIIYGIAMGGAFVIGPLLTAEYLGLKHFGAIYGILNVVGTVGGGAIGPVAPGICFDQWNTYLPVFYVFLGLILFAMILSGLMQPLGEQDRSE
jgi:MFS family permease